MKKWITVVLTLFLIIGLAACGTGGNEGTDNQGTDEKASEENGDSAGDYDAEAARASYESQCLSCHGENLEGKVGPNISDIGARLPKDAILSTIKNGKGQMPGNLLEGKEAENVANWLADMK
ncbi:cytochrome c [Pseudalkalibacillus hwajinpoensis]|uniref:c-type cytochrome n=1 Tax=Guptibacillus hwajinpoensis TaxID=208199 RepID=UPI00325B1406